MNKIGSNYDQLEEALTAVEGDLAQVQAVLAQNHAQPAIEYNGGKLYTVGEAVVDVTDKGIVTTWQDANDFLNGYNTEQYLPFDPDEQFNKDFWQHPSELYHGTLQGRLDSIMKGGLNPRNETRGMSNRGTPSAVFTSTDWDEANHYYETVLKIDTEAMKAELPPTSLPFAGRESDIVEGEGKETLAHALGYEDYSYDFEQGMSPNTVILYGAIPPKYLSVAKEDTNPSKRWHLGSKTAVRIPPPPSSDEEWSSIGPHAWKANFHIKAPEAKNGYIHYSAWLNQEVSPEPWLPIFHLPGKAYSFVFDNLDYRGPEGSFGVTGTGHTIEVGMKVGSLLLGVLRNLHPTMMYFSAKEGNRAVLYGRLTRLAAMSSGYIPYSASTSDGTYFILVSPESNEAYQSKVGDIAKPLMGKAASKTAGIGGKGWAIWEGKVLLNPTRSAHVDWFEDLGLPSSGPEFDRIPRGNYVIDPDTEHIYVWTDAETGSPTTQCWGNKCFDMEFAPPEVIEAIKDKHPKARDYQVYDEVRSGLRLHGSKNAAGILDNPKFQAWFRGSKVVDAQGNPLRCYHGTQSSVDFDEFSVDGPVYDEQGEASSSGSGTDPTAYMGAHFAQEPQVASRFAQPGMNDWMAARYEGESPKPRVIPVYLRITKPKDFGRERNLRWFIYEGKLNGHAGDEILDQAMRMDGLDPEDETDPKVTEWLQMYDTDSDFRMDQNQAVIEGSSAYADDLEEAARELAMDARERLEAAGFDGIRYVNEIERGISWIVFNPNQVKSAFGNTGKFNRKNPNMTASKTAAGEWWRRWRKTFLLKKGTILYHGTSQQFPASDISTPAWFTTSESVADHFKDWHGGEEAPRVLVYKVIKPIRLPQIDGKEDLDKLFHMFGAGGEFYGAEDMVDFISDSGLPGWYIPHNYPDGDDILLVDSGNLEALRDDSSDEEGAGQPEGAEPSLGHGEWGKDEQGYASYKLSPEEIEARKKEGSLKLAFPQNQIISPQEALDRKLFGPVYHGTTPEAAERIDAEGFKFQEGEARKGQTRHGYDIGRYGEGMPPPPVHHLGFGVYFTTNRNIAKSFNGDTMRGLKSYYLDVPRLETINFASPRKMMDWWEKNGYDFWPVAKADAEQRGGFPDSGFFDEAQVKATRHLTKGLKSKFDGVWFKGKGLKRLLDGDQVVVFDPSRVYLTDPKLAQPGEIGSQLVRKADGLAGTLLSRRDIPQEIADQYWNGNPVALTVKWRGGTVEHNVGSSQVEFVQPKTAAKSGPGSSGLLTTKNIKTQKPYAPALVNTDNRKLQKGLTKGYLTGVMHLMPSDKSGYGNVCPFASPECRHHCLNTAGEWVNSERVQNTRTYKTKLYFTDQQKFLGELRKSINSLVRKADKDNLLPAIRLNGTSDLPNLGMMMAKEYPNVQFYDYTKIPKPWLRTRPNYDITFSRSETNEAEMREALDHGINVAVVFDISESKGLPGEWMGYPVIDGDKHDLRFLDKLEGEGPFIVGLKAKGKARGQGKGSDTGFVVKVQPLGTSHPNQTPPGPDQYPKNSSQAQVPKVAFFADDMFEGEPKEE
jgi:hypothetical protein